MTLHTERKKSWKTSRQVEKTLGYEVNINKKKIAAAKKKIKIVVNVIVTHLEVSLDSQNNLISENQAVMLILL